MNANHNPSPTTHPPAVSVILPAYNVEEYIDEAIQSILAQTFTNFELIVVDDGSTDRTLEIVRGYSTNRALKIIANGENQGIPKTRNIGIAAAGGRYIAMQDADDISLPTRLAEQVAYLQANPEIALLGTARLRLSADGEIDRQSGRLLSTRPVATAAEGKSVRPTFDDLLKANHFVQGSVMLRKSVLDEVGNYDERFAYMEDYELWLRIAKHHATANLLEPLYALRSHAASATQKNTAAATLFHHLAVNTAQEQVSDAAIADIKQYGIACYYEHLSHANKVAYHKSLANTYYRNKQWRNALFQYRELNKLGGANLKARLRLWLLNCRSDGLSEHTIRNKHDSPLVTVLMPAYNSEKYIGEAIDSILNQTMRDFELVIVNDGSADNTSQIIQSYTDERIRYLDNGENRGIAESFNRAISVARGKYLAIAEHDDISHPQRFQISVSYLEKHPEIGVLSGQMDLFKGAPPTPKTIRATKRVHYSPMQIKCAAVFGQIWLIHSAQMMRASALKEHGAQYNNNYKICCDFDLFMQLIPFVKMARLSSKLVFYRLHDSNASGGINVPSVHAESNDITNQFLWSNFSLNLGAEFFIQGVVSLEYFANYMHHTELILQTVLKNKNYDPALLKHYAGNHAYKCFRLLYKSGIDYQAIFTIYQETELLHLADKEKRFRIHLKHIANKLHLYGR